jgi:3-methyladenine DNA glycosylase AlkD
MSNDTTEQLKDIKTRLRLSMNGAVAQSMRQKGVDYKMNFGVELPRIKAIAADFSPNHELADALWKEEIRECKILALLLQPTERFFPEIADIWVESIRTTELAELAAMYLFSRLDYAPALSFRWIADERPQVQQCGFLVIARLLGRKGDMDERAGNEFLDQAVTAFLSGTYPVRSAVATALRSFIRHSEENAFAACRRVEEMKESRTEAEQMLYTLVAQEVD